MWLCSLLLALGSERVVVDRDDLVIERSCTLVLPARPLADGGAEGVVRIVGDGVTIECEGTLRGAPSGTDPDRLSGTGIVVTGRDVTLRGARVAGYRFGLRALGADGLVLEDGDVSGNFRQRLGSTPEREDPSDWLWPHANDAGEWERYGAGIWIAAARGVTVRGCRAREGQNGLVLSRVEDSRVYDNDFSFLSGWGIALWRSSRNVITRNATDFCVRGYSHGVYNRGQDSAGILLFEQCSSNVIAENSATHCGDGLFAFGGREALGEVPPPAGFDHRRKGNDDNRIVGNDFSFAAAHGLELTFSFGNLVRGNRLEGNAICGLWGGYSRETRIEDNAFVANGERGYGLERGGVNIEHGQHNRILENRFERNACGVHLWWDADEAIAALPWAQANGHASADNEVLDNVFVGDAVGIQLRAAGPTVVAGNAFEGVATPLEADEGSPVREEASSEAVPMEAELPLLGTSRPVGARRALAGRERILVGEWGPYDWREPLLWRAGGTASEHRYRLLGVEDAERLGCCVLGEGVAVAREPEAIVVRGTHQGVLPYELRVEGEGLSLAAGGALVVADWSVRAFAWTSDPRQDVEAWRAEGRREGSLAFHVPALDFAFGSGGYGDLPATAGLEGAPPADRFGTVAEARIPFPAGRWRLTTLSDDGLRLWADGELLIDDWTHHAARAHEAWLELERPRAVELLVEHFELDGQAVLRLAIEPR